MAEELTQEEMAAEVKEFLERISADAMRRKIPPPIVISIFGFFARSVIEASIENGKAREAATVEAVQMFMDGLGVTTIFQRAGEDGMPMPPNVH
jgi:hypothetical protein